MYVTLKTVSMPIKDATSLPLHNLTHRKIAHEIFTVLKPRHYQCLCKHRRNWSTYVHERPVTKYFRCMLGRRRMTQFHVTLEGTFSSIFTFPWHMSCEKKTLNNVRLNHFLKLLIRRKCQEIYSHVENINNNEISSTTHSGNRNAIERNYLDDCRFAARQFSSSLIPPAEKWCDMNIHLCHLPTAHHQSRHDEPAVA